MPKKRGPTPEYDSERETRVLLEKVDSDVKTVDEQHGSIIRKLEMHDGEFEKINRRFDGLETTIGAVLRDHEGRIKKVEEKVGA